MSHGGPSFLKNAMEKNTLLPTQVDNFLMHKSIITQFTKKS